MIKRLSLSRRLLLTLFVVSFGYWTVIAWLTVRDSVDEIYQLFDAHLVHTAMALLRVADPDDMDPVDIPNSTESPSLKEIFSQWPELSQRLAKSRNERPGPSSAAAKAGLHALQAEYDLKLRFQIRDGSGRLLLKSPNAPLVTMTERDGFSETTDGDGVVWRHYGVWDTHRHIHVLVSEAHDVRNRLVQHIAMHLATPVALGLPVLIFLLWFSISRGLDPLAALTREITRRKPDSLAPLDAENTPGEVRPVVLALNQLLLRMGHSLDSERLFTANAAHELRTPLAAIQAQLHVAREAEGEAERERAMDQLQRGVERGIRLVGQLLTLARLDPEQALPEPQLISMGDLAEAACAELAPLALQKDQELELDVAPDLPLLAGNADMLSMLLCNLLDNAIRYTQRAGHISVAIRADGEGLLMEVRDNGPGIPEAQRKRVFERFYRIAGQDQPGTGLGLAICRRVAELHKAQVTLADGPHGKGLTAAVFLPMAQASE